MQQEADVLIRLEQEIRSEADELIRKAEARAAEIRRRADTEAAAFLGDARKKVEARAADLRTRRKAQAVLECRQQLGRVKAESVQEAIKVAGAQLTGGHARSRYQNALERFLTEALDALKPGKGPFRIVTRSEDESAIKKLVSSKGINAKVEASGTFSGGLEVIDEKARTRVVNTFESRLRQGFEPISERIRKVLRV